MKTSWKSVIVAVLSLGLMASVSACNPSEDTTDGPYAEEIRDARQSTDSSFQREVLADGAVTRDEYDEAMQRFVDCVEDNGSAVTLVEQTGYYVYRIEGDTATYDRVEVVCSPGTKSEVEPLFVDMLTNPSKRDYDEIIAQCMVQSGIVRPPFTTDDLATLEERAGVSTTGVSSEETSSSDPEGTEIDPEAERIIGSEEADTCRANPNYYTLVADGDLDGE